MISMSNFLRLNLASVLNLKLCSIKLAKMFGFNIQLLTHDCRRKIDSFSITKISKASDH